MGSATFRTLFCGSPRAAGTSRHCGLRQPLAFLPIFAQDVLKLLPGTGVFTTAASFCLSLSAPLYFGWAPRKRHFFGSRLSIRPGNLCLLSAGLNRLRLMRSPPSPGFSLRRAAFPVFRLFFALFPCLLSH